VRLISDEPPTRPPGRVGRFGGSLGGVPGAFTGVPSLGESPGLPAPVAAGSKPLASLRRTGFSGCAVTFRQLILRPAAETGVTIVAPMRLCRPSTGSPSPLDFRSSSE